MLVGEGLQELSVCQYLSLFPGPNKDWTHHLQLILPKFLLVCLVEEREVANMVDEDIPEDREL